MSIVVYITFHFVGKVSNNWYCRKRLCSTQSCKHRKGWFKNWQ